MEPGVPAQGKPESPSNPVTAKLKSLFLKSRNESEEIPKLKLMEGEKLYKLLHPHPLAFYDMYFIWAYVIFMSLLFIVAGPQISEVLGNPTAFILEGFLVKGDQTLLMPVDVNDMLSSINDSLNEVNETVIEYAAVTMWITLLMGISVAFSILKISWKWIGILAGVGVGSFLLALLLELPGEATYYFGIVFSLVGMYFVDKYRRSHTFYVTDYRIVTEVTFIDHKRNELGYDKINNLILDRALIARLFNFGTIIPVTASGLGMGSDLAMVTVGVAGQTSQGLGMGAAVTGGRTVQTPRVRSMYGLYGVSNPEEVQTLISQFMRDYTEAPYLKKMTGQLDEIRGGLNRRDDYSGPSTRDDVNPPM